MFPIQASRLRPSDLILERTRVTVDMFLHVESGNVSPCRLRLVQTYLQLSSILTPMRS